LLKPLPRVKTDPLKCAVCATSVHDRTRNEAVTNNLLSVLGKRWVAPGRMEAMKERMRSSCGEAHL
jgi:hypothetical protein